MRGTAFGLYISVLWFILSPIRYITHGLSHDEFLQTCNFTHYTSRQASGESKADVTHPYQGDMMIYWINLDSSIERGRVMREHLDAHRYAHRRMKGYTLNDIYVPDDVNHRWTHGRPVVYTEEYPPPRNTLNASSPFYNYSIVLSGLWGRHKHNRIKEVGCTISHLMTIHQACQDALQSGKKYAMITEDDIFFPFEVNYTALIETAPNDFGILQVFNSNEGSMENTYRQYRSKGRLWITRYHASRAAFWSTCAYIINCDVVRPLIQHIVKYRPDGWIDVKLIASPKSPQNEWQHDFCEGAPEECCFSNVTENPKVICAYSPRGYQADAFLYALTRTYVLSIPIITNGITGNLSTFHQDHVYNLHHNAFVRQRKYMNELSHRPNGCPSFILPLCQQPLPVANIVKRYLECLYRYKQPRRRRDAFDPPTFYQLKSSYDVMAADPHRLQKYRHIMDNQKSIVENIGLKYQEIAYISRSDIVIPDDVFVGWASNDCLVNSKEALAVDRDAISSSREPKLSDQSASKSYKVYISGLCGRGRGRDSIQELNHTLSHLLAIYHAVNDPMSSSPYAIISDDAVESFPFDIDYKLLTQSASSFLSSWGIVYLSSSYDETAMTKQWVQYVRSGHKTLWSHRNALKFPDSWSWKSYLISKNVLRPIINSIITRKTSPSTDIVIYDIKVIAGMKGSCVPSIICAKTQETSPLSYVIDSPRGFGYDVFIPSLARTILANIPLYKSSESYLYYKVHYLMRDIFANNSKIEAQENHQIHYTISRQNDFIKGILEDKHELPHYANKSCIEVVK